MGYLILVGNNIVHKNVEIWDLDWDFDLTICVSALLSMAVIWDFKSAVACKTFWSISWSREWFWVLRAVTSFENNRFYSFSLFSMFCSALVSCSSVWLLALSWVPSWQHCVCLSSFVEAPLSDWRGLERSALLGEVCKDIFAPWKSRTCARSILVDVWVSYPFVIASDSSSHFCCFRFFRCSDSSQINVFGEASRLFGDTSRLSAF